MNYLQGKRHDASFNMCSHFGVQSLQMSRPLKIKSNWSGSTTRHRGNEAVYQCNRLKWHSVAQQWANRLSTREEGARSRPCLFKYIFFFECTFTFYTFLHSNKTILTFSHTENVSHVRMLRYIGSISVCIDIYVSYGIYMCPIYV